MPITLVSKKRFSILFLSIFLLADATSYAAEKKQTTTLKLTKKSIKDTLLGVTPSGYLRLIGEPITTGVIRLSTQMDADIAEGGVAYRSGLYFRGRPIYWANENYSKDTFYLPARKQALFSVLAELEGLSLTREATKADWCVKTLGAANRLNVWTEFKDVGDCDVSPSIGLRIASDRPTLDSILVNSVGPDQLVVILQYSCANCVPLKGPNSIGSPSSFSSHGLVYVPVGRRNGVLLGALLPLILNH